MEIIKEYPEVLEMHGFYVYPDQKIVTFDLIIDFEVDNIKIRDSIHEKLLKLYPDYQFYIILDKDFSD